jgi:tRNA nucleotidyltransferase/poly(A) polymerase
LLLLHTGFKLEAGTAAALHRYKELLLTDTTPTRLRQEMQRLLCHGAAAAALQLLQEHGLMELLLPVHHQYLQRCQQDR